MRISAEDIKKFKRHLICLGKSKSTVEKYMRDAMNFANKVECVNGESVLAYRKILCE